MQSDFWSTTGNADTIVVQGKTNERHQILNEVGSTIEVARRCVDDNKDNHCSFGLHVGSYDYANGWAGESGRLLVVEFDPQDAVSVPTDCDFQKLRVCKYKVVSDITDTRKEINKPVYEPNKPIYGSDDDIDFDEDEDYDDDFVDQGEWEDDEELDLDEDMFNLEVRNYIENKLENSERVTINHVNSLKICRDSNMTCAKTLDLVIDLGFEVENNDDLNKSVSQLEIVA